MFNLFKRKSETPRLKCLRNMSLFSTLGGHQLSIVDLLMHDRLYLAGEVIFDEGEVGQGIYIILSGRVGIYRHEFGSKKIAELGDGDFFGELALLDDMSRMAQARAESDCVLAVMSRREFLGLLETHAVIASKISLQLARHLGQRLRSVREVGAES
jgi:CRP-like cAMP-binding protein